MLYETFSCPLVFLQTVLHFKHCSHFVCVLFCYNVSYLIIIYIFDVYDSLQLGMKKYSLSFSYVIPFVFPHRWNHVCSNPCPGWPSAVAPMEMR